MRAHLKIIYAALIGLFFINPNILSAEKITYADAESKINNWFKENCSVEEMNPKLYKSLEFPKQGLCVNAYFQKGKIIEGGSIKITNLSNPDQVILYGNVTHSDETLVVSGIYSMWTDTLDYSLYGLFQVSNTPEHEFCYKPRKASEFTIDEVDLSFYKDENIIISLKRRLNSNPFIVHCLPSHNTKWSLFAELPEQSDYHRICDIFQGIKNNVSIYGENGDFYRGTIDSISCENNGKRISILSYGFGTFFFNSNNCYTTVNSKSPTEILVTYEYCADSNDKSKEMYIIPFENKGIQDYWNSQYVRNRAQNVSIIFKNGTKYQGEFEMLGDTILQFTNGTFTYSNGDKFVGNLQGKKIGNIFCDGYTILISGKKISGANFLKHDFFLLTKEQQRKILRCNNPTDMINRYKREISGQKDYKHKHKGDCIQYFHPYFECLGCLCDVKYLSYNTSTGYFCKSEETDRRNPAISIMCMENGKRLEELVYETNDKEEMIPAYYTQYEWYDNGVVEHIRSYEYNTNYPIMSMHFFSDGKLRSAYRYGVDKNGKVILRKSKESHPNYGYYTSKLYDLNGQFERVIEWDIGEGKGLYGERYDKYASDYVPRALDLKKDWIEYDPYEDE